MPTVAIFVSKDYAPIAPRVVYVRFPFGHPLGEPNRADRQGRVVLDALEGLNSITEPGTIIDLPYQWRRT
ncbi:MAG: hypothetical protein HY664_00680 [Chloroflexi bacterium]|nr:hypothetical protein [Chloroflexota bacterium]